MRCKKRRRSITLLEIMIVILLIGLIGGVLSYNLKGSLDRGKKFRTEEAIRRIKDILNLEIERGAVTLQEIMGDPLQTATKIKTCLVNSGFISSSDVDNFLLDGWKENYTYSVGTAGELVITSARLQAYNQAHPGQ